MALNTTILLVFLILTVTAWSYPNEAGLFPLLVGVVGTLLAGLHLVMQAVRLRVDPHVEAQDQTHDGNARYHCELGHLAWFAGLVIAVVLLGFSLGGPIWMFGYLVFGKHERVWLAAGLALGLTLFLFGVFELGMGIRLFAGILLT